MQDFESSSQFPFQSEFSASSQEASQSFSFPFMREALIQACKAFRHGAIPVGAVVVKDGEIVSSAYNGQIVESLNLPRPLLHAEMIAVTLACTQLNQNRLDGCDLYTTLEPCPFCFSALNLLRIKRIFFGAYDPDKGFSSLLKEAETQNGRHPIENLFNHKIDIFGGFYEERCSALLSSFFRLKRKKAKNKTERVE